MESQKMMFILFVGSAMLIAKVGGLCNDMEGTCEERGRDKHVSLLSNPDALFRHCEVVQTILGCIEEYMCTCNVTVTVNLDQTFIDTANEYLETCHNATSHKVRLNTRLQCMEGKPLPEDAPGDPEEELKVKDTISRAEIQDLDSRLLQECTPYAHCSEVYHNAMGVAAYLPNPQQRFAALCLANRLNIVCMSDSFCTCKEGDNELLQKAMKTILEGHQDNCQEKISEPIMQCSGAVRSTLSILLFVLTTALLQISFSAF